MSTYLVYKITCTINNKSYVGVTNDLQRRLRDHRNPRSSCKALYNAISAHGWDAFSVCVLVEGLDRHQAYELEPILIVDHQTRVPAGYNITAGGWNGRSGMSYVMSAEHKHKISESHKGKRHTDDTKRKLSEQRKTAEYQQRQRAIRSTEEHKRKLEAGQHTDAMLAEKARRLTQEYRVAASERRAGIPHSSSRKRKILITSLIKSLQRVDSGERVGVAVDPRSSIKPWIARIRTDGKSTYIGAYSSECEAQAAYRTRLVELIEFYQASESLVVAEAQTSADR